MTRGTFICIYGDDGTCLKSTEFNGDMYISIPGHGLNAYDLCQKVNTVDEFMREVIRFDQDFFNYGDISFTPMNINLGFHGDVYDKWNFSDYLYIVNLTESTFTVDAYDTGKKVEIPARSAKVLYFGTEFDFVKEIYERRAAE